jgi:hypothetical protein
MNTNETVSVTGLKKKERKIKKCKFEKYFSVDFIDFLAIHAVTPRFSF